MSSPYQRSSDGLWCVSVELPPGPGGRRRRKVVTARRRADAIAKARAVRRDLDRAGDLPTSSPTLAQWLERWLQRPRRPNTQRLYELCVRRYIVPPIGRIRLARLRPEHVEQMHAYVLSLTRTVRQPDGTVVEQPLSSTTAQQAHRVLSAALNDAMRMDLVGRNVTTLVKAPAKAAVQRPVLSAADASAALLAAGRIDDDDRTALRAALALIAGMRQGEALGLTWEEIHLDRGYLDVRWQLQRLAWRHGCGGTCGRKRGAECPQRHVPFPADVPHRHIVGGLWLTPPKSARGVRRVPLVHPLDQILASYMSRHEPGPQGLLITDERGMPLDPRRDAERFDALLQYAGVPDVPLHSARHTANTLLFELGVPDQVREALLGHTAPANAVYTRVGEQQLAQALGSLGQLLAPRDEP